MPHVLGFTPSRCDLSGRPGLLKGVGNFSFFYPFVLCSRFFLFSFFFGHLFRYHFGPLPFPGFAGAVRGIEGLALLPLSQLRYGWEPCSEALSRASSPVIDVSPQRFILQALGG